MGVKISLKVSEKGADRYYKRAIKPNCVRCDNG